MSKEELEQRITALYKILLGMNAYGTLDLSDMFIIENYLKLAFDFDIEKVN